MNDTNKDVIGQIINNTCTWEFKSNEEIVLYYSFDNIQQLILLSTLKNTIKTFLI